MKQLFGMLAIFVLVVNIPNIKVLMAGDIQYDPAISGPVTLYATKSCGYCARTRAFLRKNDIPYTELDVEESSDAMRQLTTFQAFGVPVIVVGDTVIRGYQPGALAEALNSNP